MQTRFTSPLFYVVLAALLPIASAAQSQQRPDAPTAAWWAQTKALANDSMQGRDTGSEAYERAATYVATQFVATGLKPAGDNNTFFQRVPMRQVDLNTTNSSVAVEISSSPDDIGIANLKLLDQVTLQASENLPLNIRANMLFIGYGLAPAPPATPAPPELRGRIVVYFAGVPSGLSSADRLLFITRRTQFLAASGAEAIVAILNPADTEPFHWPAAYARTVVLAGTSASATSTPSLHISANAAPILFSKSGHDFARVLQAGEHGDPLPSFNLPAILRLHLETVSKDISSPNILAILPGSDSKLAPEYVALSAHLDGYGYGTSVLGDNLYNGALDDAAYVATLIELAKDLQHKAPARSLLFCIFTGEEKGLLGSAWFTQHPTVPPTHIVADLNLDQLRPIFPLHILTMEGLTDSTLGDTVRTVAAGFNIKIRPDLEPERNLFRRADNYNFVRIDVPIASFIFGYNKGSPEEVIYRDWYARRYHKPQDDLQTPIDWTAAGKFNSFYAALAVAIANAPSRPQWLPSSPYSPHQRTSP
jgi:Peptidase family M28